MFYFNVLFYLFRERGRGQNPPIFFLSNSDGLR